MKNMHNTNTHPTLNTSPNPHLQNVLPCEHSCYTWDLRLGTMYEVVSPNFHALLLAQIDLK